jgi:hypothetical protein
MEPGAVLFFGENAEQDLAKPRDGTDAGSAISGGDPGPLRRRQPPLQFTAAVRQLQKALPAVVGATTLRDKPLPHELAQYSAQALFRDAQNAKQFADRHLRVAADEMHDPVMRPPETVRREYRVGLRGKIPIRKEQQLDALANRLIADFRRLCLAFSGSAIYVSHVDLFCNIRYILDGVAI